MGEIMNNINAYTVASYILGEYPDKNITPMKLQKLAYYSKVWSLISGKNVVVAEFKKWDYGPVNYDIYKKYQKYGKSVIPPESGQVPSLPEEQEELLKFILDNYVDLSAFALSNMTHNEDPWINTPKDAVISDNLIVQYYSQQPFAKNFTDNNSFENGPFHLLKSDNWHSFTLDMSEDEAVSFESYSSYKEYLKLFKKADEESKNFLKEVFN